MQTSEASFLPCSKRPFSLIFKNYRFELKELWILASLSFSLTQLPSTAGKDARKIHLFSIFSICIVRNNIKKITFILIS